MKCTFFGNRNIKEKEAENVLWEILIDLVENKNVNTFYVGNQGGFDYLVQKQLKILKEKYKYINYGVALAYVPSKKEEYDRLKYDIAFLPQGVEEGPIKFAIDRRNRWMIKNSDYVVTCVRGVGGGAAKYKEIAERKGKIIINIFQ